MEALSGRNEMRLSAEEYMGRKLSIPSLFLGLASAGAFLSIVLRKELAENFTEIPDDFPALAIFGVVLAYASTILSYRKKFRQRAPSFLPDSFQEYFQNTQKFEKSEIPKHVAEIIKGLREADGSKRDHWSLGEHNGDIIIADGGESLRSYIERSNGKHYVDYSRDSKTGKWEVSRSWKK